MNNDGNTDFRIDRSENTASGCSPQISPKINYFCTIDRDLRHGWAISFVLRPHGTPNDANRIICKRTMYPDKPLVAPALYLPPISYFTAIRSSAHPVLIEQHEHFPKQTYRTRASIHGANGKLDLIIPVKKGSKVHTPMKDVRISYESNWQRLHWLSMQTAYRTSAFFEYYEHEFAGFYERQYAFLLDYNMELFELLLRLLKLDVAWELTDRYQADYPERIDLRALVHPKKEAPRPVEPYYQVFASKNGFLPNLSIVDLLFNLGPQSKSHL